MNRTTSTVAQCRPNALHDRSLNSKAFSVLLSSVFALTLGAAAIGWSEASASTTWNARVAPGYVPPPPPERSDMDNTNPSEGIPGDGAHGGCELV